MDSMLAARNPAEGRDEQFATTHWSEVLAAADVTSPRAQAALGALYQAYFYPLYGFVRRQGHSEPNAQDLLHDFFRTLIERIISRVSPANAGGFVRFCSVR